MKIQVLSRSISAHQPPGSDVPKLQRNLDPALHPFARAGSIQERKLFNVRLLHGQYLTHSGGHRLNATKLERLFAKPFLCQLGNGHVDGVYTLAKDARSLQRFGSGSGDGVVKVWDLTTKDEIWHTTAHENIVKGLAWTADSKLLSCAADRSVKLFDPYNTESDAAPISTWLGTSAFTSLSVHRSRDAFAVSSNVLSIYDLNRHTAAPEVLQWPNSTDTITAVTFNQVETSVLASCATDRSIVLYDLRTSVPLSKTVLNFATNSISWNPQEAFNFACANEDHNVYIFDMRKIDRALNILKGHVAAVMDVEFSPTGEELVSASWDRTTRIWNRDKGHSRDVYFTRRMQRVFAANWTPDSKYIITGSDDGNVRLWRAKASERQGVKSARERQSLEYANSLSQRYGHMPEIRRIKRHRHVPKVIMKAGQIKAEELAAIKRREANERKHSKKKFEKRISERDKTILAKEK